MISTISKIDEADISLFTLEIIGTCHHVRDDLIHINISNDEEIESFDSKIRNLGKSLRQQGIIVSFDYIDPCGSWATVATLASEEKVLAALDASGIEYRLHPKNTNDSEKAWAIKKFHEFFDSIRQNFSNKFRSEIQQHKNYLQLVS